MMEKNAKIYLYNMKEVVMMPNLTFIVRCMHVSGRSAVM